ncbi:hypothetical protein Plec18167_005487 [Paecilomyces lecythidis]|uniref:MT-A70 family n=1 Tax=Paecilomyces lecythidis TaxID=3004212 RepID=A0ABR3XHX5_9EURO
MAHSAIIYQNSEKTIFIIDIPSSISVSQYIPSYIPGISQPNRSQQESKCRQRHILSAPPLKDPYPSPPEPKTETARKRVLERIPAEERALHGYVFGPLVKDALRELKQNHDEGSPWCFPRRLVEETNESRRAAKKRRLNEDDISPCSIPSRSDTDLPPLILSPGENDFESLSELQNVLVKNTSTVSAILNVKGFTADAGNIDGRETETARFTVPPQSTFLFSTLPMEPPVSGRHKPIPGIPTEQKFNMILLDPPWPNRSVRRSSHYVTHAYSNMDALTGYIEAILQTYLYKPDGVSLEKQKQGEKDTIQPSQKSIAAIWVTNTAKSRKAAYDAMLRSGLSVTEEWIWVKTTVDGEPVSPVDGLWRKPYEVLVIGQRDIGNREGKDQPKLRRVIAAVPDIHSRKPNLKELFEMLFFSVMPPDGGTQEYSSRVEYSALEIFARNITAGWWACGNEVLKFNNEAWWVTND